MKFLFQSDCFDLQLRLKGNTWFRGEFILRTQREADLPGCIACQSYGNRLRFAPDPLWQFQFQIEPAGRGERIAQHAAKLLLPAGVYGPAEIVAEKLSCRFRRLLHAGKTVDCGMFAGFRQNHSFPDRNVADVAEEVDPFGFA